MALASVVSRFSTSRRLISLHRSPQFLSASTYRFDCTDYDSDGIASDIAHSRMSSGIFINNLDPATNVFIPHHEKKSGHFLDRVEAAEHLKVRREVLDLLGDFASALPDDVIDSLVHWKHKMKTPDAGAYH